jgi:hypothetical protein
MLYNMISDISFEIVTTSVLANNKMRFSALIFIFLNDKCNGVTAPLRN